MTSSSSPNLAQYERLGKELVHELATPLASLQLKLDVLTQHWASLTEHFIQAPHAFDPSFETLLNIPSAMQADIQRLRTTTQDFLQQLSATYHSPLLQHSQMFNPTQQQTFQRILLIDDEAIHHQIVLKQLGDDYAVDFAIDATEALSLCDECRYDVILLDLVLPGLNDHPISTRIRSTLSKDACILAFSSWPLTQEDWQAIGVDGFLSKPFKRDQFLALIDAQIL